MKGDASLNTQPKTKYTNKKRTDKQFELSDQKLLTVHWYGPGVSFHPVSHYHQSCRLQSPFH